MLSNEFLSFKTKEVRDLAWAIFSPCIIKGDLVSDGVSIQNIHFSRNEISTWLKELDSSALPLISFIEKHKSAKRLGKYFEILLLYFFQNQKEIERLHFSLQVKKSKDNTIGEFDFLLQSAETKNWTHLEVAVKFYLATELKIEGHSKLFFVGPNAKDRLDLKLNKLYNKQMLLGNTEEGESSLKNLGIEYVEQNLLVKGYLFYNLIEPPRTDTPPFINDYCWKGWWSYYNDFPFYSYSKKKFVVLNKLEWLSPFVGNEDRVVDVLLIREQVENRKIELPVLMVEVEFNGCEWQEINRGFLVKDNWLNGELI